MPESSLPFAMSRPRGRSTTCVIMEGYLTIPPDRGTILGRALWKTRYVVIGSAQGEVDDGKSRSSVSDGITYLSIYKNPDDWEPSQQYAVNNITSCQVQMVAHRKQGPVLPTLVITIASDPATEKLRKRRSSRAATLVSNKDNGPTTLWFRTEGDSSRLYEWARSIQLVIQPALPENLPMSPMSPMSPITPASPSFQNPFVAFTPREGCESSPFSSGRPPSAPKVTLHHKASSSLHAQRERPLTISGTPSLRSRRSDLSSLISCNVNTATTQSYASILPHDFSTPSETDAELFGWTSAQGRSSVLHSPARTIRDSVDSDPPLSPAALLDSGSPPGPRETILDRAFQMKYIPGSDQTVPGEEKLSSLARFEALMKQADERRQSRIRPVRPVSVKEQLELKSAWDMDDSDEEDSDSDSVDTEEESSAAENTADDPNSIRPVSRRTAKFPGTPQTPAQSPRGTAGPRSPIALNSETLAVLNSGAPSDRPRLVHRMHSTMGSLSLGTQQLSLETSPGKSSIESSESWETSGLNPAAAYRTSTIMEGQQRHSTASSNGGKRLSFTEFTRRLSNTGSMLLTQQSGSSPGDATDSQGQSRRSSVLQPRTAPSVLSSPRSEVTDRSEKCKSWRNSVGMFGNEGGFL
ncbi:hypothetical protein N0V93_006702 [Gnomoniopsis smithogilvyi]|uniref:PH domain-containing protein n=1 Tax=Gnomoniopsis smithogilvyi TaxID=1191159 RepID=A0A9W8YQ73_9PEZI|nr:hypothetical protein N0V93_006702 [Gnomoniopsis smithogilvyi]